MTQLIVIDAPHFYAGAVVEGGVVTRAAPIIKYMIGWPAARVKNYALSKRWRIVD